MWRDSRRPRSLPPPLLLSAWLLAAGETAVLTAGRAGPGIWQGSTLSSLALTVLSWLAVAATPPGVALVGLGVALRRARRDGLPAAMGAVFLSLALVTAFYQFLNFAAGEAFLAPDLYLTLLLTAAFLERAPRWVAGLAALALLSRSLTGAEGGLSLLLLVALALASAWASNLPFRPSPGAAGEGGRSSRLGKAVLLPAALFLLVPFLDASAVSRDRAPPPRGGLSRSLAAFHAGPRAGVILVAAHRGFSYGVPENSIRAIECAIAAGCDFVELDVKATRDGELVLMHDVTLDRTTTGRGKVKDLTRGRLAALRLRGAGGPDPEPVPTLAQALEAARGRILVLLDNKSAPLEELTRTVSGAGTVEQTVFLAKRAEERDRIRSFLPRAMVMVRLADPAEEAGLSPGEGAVLLSRAAAEGRTAARVRRAGLHVCMNSRGPWETAAGFGFPDLAFGPVVARGATIIITNRPTSLLAYLRRRGWHW